MAASTATDDKQAQTTAATSTNRTDDDRRQIDVQRDDAVREFERYELELAEAGQASDMAIDKIVGAWADAAALLVPRAVLRPFEAVDVLFGTVEQLLEIQRRMVIVLLGTTRLSGEVAYAEDRSTRERSSNGKVATQAPRSARRALVG